MNILYFGTVCNADHYNQILQHCRQKPTVATVVFENALLEGWRQNGAEAEIHSFPMIPTFPGYKKLYFGGQREHLPSGYSCRWLRTVNLPVLKQLSRRLDGRRMLRRWCRQHRQNGVIFTYSIPPFLVKDVLQFGRKYGIATVAIIPDLLRDMYIHEKQGPLMKKLRQLYLRPALKRQGEYDGYIYLTDAMRQAVAPEKPCLVMEGLLDPAAHPQSHGPKASPPAVMYAGQLQEGSGILQLLEAFEKAQLGDAQLWIFGAGAAAPEIEKRAGDNPRIRYFGARPRHEVLRAEQAATLLVNPRSPGDGFTRYSFPSKLMEYLHSGTPVLTTRLPGIPEEYFEYVISASDNHPQQLAAALEQVLRQPQGVLDALGAAARAFVAREKNTQKQGKRMLEFMQEVSKNAENQPE